MLNMAFDRTLLPLSATLTEAVAFARQPRSAGDHDGRLRRRADGRDRCGCRWSCSINLSLAVAGAYPGGALRALVPGPAPFAISFVRTLFFMAPGLVALSEIHGRTHDLVRSTR